MNFCFFLLKSTHWVLSSSLSCAHDIVMRCVWYWIAKRLCEQLDDLNFESWQIFHKTFKRKTTRLFNIKLIELLNTRDSHIVLRDARIVLRDARIEMRDSLTTSLFLLQRERNYFFQIKNIWQNSRMTKVCCRFFNWDILSRFFRKKQISTKSCESLLFQQST